MSAFEKIFKAAQDDFGALSAAKRWLAEHDISYGSTQASSPIGLMVGDVGIAKWRNLSREDIATLDGRITFRNGGPRDGDVVVTLTAGAAERAGLPKGVAP